MKTKKLAALFLTLAMLLGISPLSVLASDNGGASPQISLISAFIEPDVIEVAIGDTRTEAEIMDSFPDAVSATVNGTEGESVPVTKWSLVYASTADGAFSTAAQAEFYYEPTLAGSYTLSGEAILPSQKVQVGEALSHEPALASTGVQVGDFIVTGGTQGTDYEYDSASKVLTITGNAFLEISMASGVSSPTTNTIVVQSGVHTYLTLNDVSIDVSGTSDACAFDIQGNATADITLADGSTNTLTSGNGKAGLQVQSTTSGGTTNTATLNLSGSGSLTATGSGGGAGIGGGNGGAGGTITIADGNVTATGSAGGAGIGGGDGGAGGEITISGGNVTATGSAGGAGIGGGAGGAGDGTFRTQGGNALITASSISDRTSESSWNGIFAIGASSNTFEVYGNPILVTDFTLTTGKTLIVPSGKTITVPSGRTLYLLSGATLTIEVGGEVQNEGTIYNYGTITGENLITGSGNIYPQTGNADPLVNLSVTSVYLRESGSDKEISYNNSTWQIYTGTVNLIGSTTTNVVQVLSGEHNIILNGVNIDVSSASDPCAFKIAGSATANITLQGTNTLQSGSDNAGLQVNSAATLHILAASTGTLNATGGSDAAGIGGGTGGAGGTITISGGSVTAIGSGGGAGIGDGTGGSGGTFQTQLAGASPGYAFITASSISDNDDTSGWNGMFAIGASSEPFKVYGSPALNTDITLPTGKTLIVPSGKTITVPSGRTLYLLSGATLTIEDGGEVQNEGTIYNYGTITGEERITGSGNIYPERGNANPRLNLAVTSVYLRKNGSDKEFSYNNSTWQAYTGTITFTGTTNTYTVTVQSGEHDIILSGLNIDVSSAHNACALEIAGNATANITLHGANTLKSSGNKAGLQVQRITSGGSTTTATLNLSGAGSLSATGGGDAPGGAGIGGGWSGDGGNITISGGNVTATGGPNATGIGGGGNSGAGGNITISGGTVRATGGGSSSGTGAGIGGGSSTNGGPGGNITISGGTVTATGGSGIHGGAAGIGGGGNGGDGGNITISGGNVTATGGVHLIDASKSGGAGIGGGWSGDGGNITIKDNATVEATGNGGGAGIGGGGDTGHGGIITILGGNVTATGDAGGHSDSGSGFCGGIGDGLNGTGGIINIKGGTVTATGINGAQAFSAKPNLSAAENQMAEVEIVAGASAPGTAVLPSSNYHTNLYAKITMDSFTPTIHLGTSLTYSGTQQTQTVTSVMQNSTPLTVNTDYTISGNTATNAGEYTLTITGAGNYVGVLTKTYTIQRAPLTITGATAQSRAYNGIVDATADVRFGGLVNGETLTKGTDYTVSADFPSPDVGDNLTVGGVVHLANTAKASNYIFSNAEFSFPTTASITPLALAGAQVALGTPLVANGTQQTQSVASITLNGRTLTEGTDYTLSGNTATDAGSYTLTVTGKGNYSGTLAVPFTVVGTAEEALPYEPTGTVDLDNSMKPSGNTLHVTERSEAQKQQDLAKLREFAQQNGITGEVHFLADITMTDANGNEVQPENGNTRVRISVPGVTPGDTVTVLHIKDDGSVEEITPVYVYNGYVEFFPTSFSVYSVIVHKAGAGTTSALSPQTGVYG